MLTNFFNNILMSTSALYQQAKYSIVIWNFFISGLTTMTKMKIILYFEAVK